MPLVTEGMRDLSWGWVIALAFGAVFGSFINVVIYRLPRGLSVVNPPSACPNCKERIKPYDNIPVLSYLLLRGKCRSCGNGVSIRYPAVEALGALLTVLAYLLAPTMIEMLVWSVLALTLLAVTFIDLDFRIIPDRITLPGIILGLFYSFAGPLSIVDSLLGVLAGGGGLLLVALGYYWVTKREGLGMGDVKLMAMIGAFLGWQGVLGTLFIGSLAGSVVSVGIILAGKGNRMTAFPFGTYLAPAAWIFMFAGPRIWEAYLQLFF